jgi:hypothetical protein
MEQESTENKMKKRTMDNKATNKQIAVKRVAKRARPEGFRQQRLIATLGHGCVGRTASVGITAIQ